MPGRSVTSVSGWPLMAPLLRSTVTPGIAHMLVGTGELVEQGGLTAVLVASQRKGEVLSSGRGFSPFLMWYFPPSPRPGDPPFYHLPEPPTLPGPFRWGDADLRGIVPAGGSGLISMDAQLHGVAHGCQLDQRDLRPPGIRAPYPRKMLAQVRARRPTGSVPQPTTRFLSICNSFNVIRSTFSFYPLSTCVSLC